MTEPRIEVRSIFSPDREYRYTLWRQWFFLSKNPRFVQWIGLNPSTADEVQDDPTVRRCINYSKAWGYDAMCMTNIFAFRATDPKEMMAADEPIGPENNLWLSTVAEQADLIIACWGARGKYKSRAKDVCWLIRSDMHCLGVTAGGEPRHPLYMQNGIEPRHYGGKPYHERHDCDQEAGHG